MEERINVDSFETTGLLFLVGFVSGSKWHQCTDCVWCVASLCSPCVAPFLVWAISL